MHNSLLTGLTLRMVHFGGVSIFECLGTKSPCRNPLSQNALTILPKSPLKKFFFSFFHHPKPAHTFKVVVIRFSLVNTIRVDYKTKDR